MSGTFTSSDITTGSDVLGSDGEKVGTVAAVYPGYIVVEKGFFFPTDYYVPMSAVASADDNQVYLNVAKDAALGSGWDAQPVDLETASYDTTTSTDTMDVGTGYAASDVGAGYGIGTAQTASSVTSDEEIRIPVMEEELTATVRSQEAGAVRVEKDVVTEQRTLNVPITEEQVRVERRVVERPVSAADASAFENVVIDVPLRTETVDVQKQARVAEEIVLSKEAVERTEQVTDTVRREEVFVDEDVTTIEGGETRSSRSI
ncbi:MAG TPA: DUF2382 domain-containing protein [Thermomicrobiales bacterium]|nr:DUF2382 domain-containing protein [Thermomicrobiales bacterium]